MSRRKPATRHARAVARTTRDQVRLPALGLFVVAGFWISGLLVYMAFKIWQLTLPTESASTGDPLSTDTMLPVQLGWSAIMLVASIVIAIGALQMYRLSSRRLAWCAAILSVIPGIAPCYIGALPLGIWTIIVLRRPDVAAAFKGRAPLPNRG